MQRIQTGWHDKVPGWLPQVGGRGLGLSRGADYVICEQTAQLGKWPSDQHMLGVFKELQEALHHRER